MTQLVIDIGNTRTKYALFEGRQLLRWLDEPEPAEVAVIGSVCPPKEPTVLASLSVQRVLFARRDLPPPLEIRVDEPLQVGVDRLAKAIAGFERTHSATIIVSFGTAVVLDVVGPSGEFLGGAIAPGLVLSLRALSTGTALLPQVEPAPAPVIARNTADAMRAGVVNGTASLTDGLIAAMEAELGVRPKVLATGGDAPLLAPLCRRVEQVVPHLTLEGLNLWYLKAAQR